MEWPAHTAVGEPGDRDAGTYGNIFEGFDETDSLPIPSRMGVFEAIVNITSDALSVNERPFHSANPNAAGVPTVYGSRFGRNLCVANY